MPNIEKLSEYIYFLSINGRQSLAAQLLSLFVEQQKGQHGDEMAEVPFKLGGINWWLVSTLINATHICCFGKCCSELVTFMWFCQQRNASFVHDTYHACSQVSCEVPGKFSTWFRNVRGMDNWLQKLYLLTGWKHALHSPPWAWPPPWVCGVLDALHSWASLYGSLCVCPYPWNVLGVFSPVCVLALTFV